MISFKSSSFLNNSFFLDSVSSIFFILFLQKRFFSKEKINLKTSSKKKINLYFEEGSNQRNSSNGMVSNIDELPFPDWKDYVKQYPLKNNFIGFNSKIAIPLLVSRGCPYSCFHYCTYPLQQGRKVRQRSVENVIKEIKHWIENLKTKSFLIFLVILVDIIIFSCNSGQLKNIIFSSPQAKMCRDLVTLQTPHPVSCSDL